MTEDMVLVSTDCVSDLTPELQERYQIPVMYYYIHTEEARFQDTIEITSDNLVEYMEVDGKRAYSSCASVEEYRTFFEKQMKKTKGEIIHICVAKHVSDAWETATEAAKDLERVHVVNSGHLSGGMGIMVLAAADMAECGAPCEVILEELVRLKDKISTSFIVDSTECLYRNGKIGRRIALFCENLLLHPILKLSKSRMKVAGICIGSRQYFAKTYIRHMLRDKKTIVPDIVFLITAGCSYEFEQFLRREIEKQVPWKRVIVNTASATISCNCGSGAFGVLFLRK
ncbi:MAG: DegV family protein [Lachnospiraceae bacterium]